MWLDVLQGAQAVGQEAAARANNADELASQMQAAKEQLHTEMQVRPSSLTWHIHLVHAHLPSVLRLLANHVQHAAMLVA